MKSLTLLLGLLVLFLATSVAVAQNAPSPPDTRTVADETFDLNISERHIQEKDFQASTSLELATGNAKDVRVQVGVSVRASAIDVTLRNVTGTVRFRGSLQSILDLLQTRSPTRSPREK
jgi:hypothetical protein